MLTKPSVSMHEALGFKKKTLWMIGPEITNRR
jgi:hypothetical protein